MAKLSLSSWGRGMASELWLSASMKSFRVMWNFPWWSFTMAKSVRSDSSNPSRDFSW